VIPAAGLQGIVAFVQTVEAGSFTLAAKRMGLSKSAVAKSVARMEARLGVTLVNRTTRRLSVRPRSVSLIGAFVSCRLAGFSIRPVSRKGNSFSFSPVYGLIVA